MSISDRYLSALPHSLSLSASWAYLGHKATQELRAGSCSRRSKALSSKRSQLHRKSWRCCYYLDYQVRLHSFPSAHSEPRSLPACVIRSKERERERAAGGEKDCAVRFVSSGSSRGLHMMRLKPPLLSMAPFSGRNQTGLVKKREGERVCVRGPLCLAAL